MQKINYCWLLIMLTLASCVEQVDPSLAPATAQQENLEATNLEENQENADQNLHALTQNTTQLTVANSVQIPYTTDQSADVLDLDNAHENKKTKLVLVEQETVDLGFFEQIPKENLATVLSYAGLAAAGNIRQLNCSFYQLMTGYGFPGLIGVVHKPLHKGMHAAIFAANEAIDFHHPGLGNLTPEHIPSFLFYQLLKNAQNLPASFWSHIKDTRIEAINLSENAIGDDKVVDLAHALQRSQVKAINLELNKLSDKGVKNFLDNLKEIKVNEFYLGRNHITASGAKNMAEFLPESVDVLDLSYNALCSADDLAQFAKNLAHKKIGFLGLQECCMGVEGTISLVKNLKNKAIWKLDLSSNNIEKQGALAFAADISEIEAANLDLSMNGIEDAGADAITQHLSEKIQILNLGFNFIKDEGAVLLAKNLQHKKVHTLYLYCNEITATGAYALAEQLQNSTVKSVFLGTYDKIDEANQEQIRQAYPNMHWDFDYMPDLNF